MKFYVYELVDSRDHLPFYVGKGTGNRVNKHENNARNGIDTVCCKHIRNIWENGGQVEHSIIFKTDNEADAYSKEKERIEEIGIGNLVNIVRGGGATLSPEVAKSIAERISRALTGKHLSEESRRKNSEAHKGKKKSPETRKRMSEARIGEHPTEETRRKLSESHKGLTTWNKGKITPEETRIKQSEAAKKRFENIEELKRLSQINIGRHASEETRAKMRDSQKLRRKKELGAQQE
jgi:hypothetical protein